MEKFMVFFGCFVAVLALVLLQVWAIMYFWNLIIPSLFGISSISFYQAFGLKVIVSFLIPSNTQFNKDK